MKYEILRTEAEVSALIEWHNANSEFVVVDIETTGLDSFKDEIVDVQITGKSGDEVAIFSGIYSGALCNLATLVVGHNLRFDITFLYRRPVDVTHWRYHDTLLLAHLENENRASYSLDALLKEFYGESHKEAFWAKYKTYQEAPEEERYAYGAADVVATGRLYRELRESNRRGGIPDSLVEHVHHLQYALLKTEIKGIQVDEPYLVNLGVGLKSKIENLLPRMREMVGMEADLVEMRLWLKELEKRKTDKGRANVPRPKFTFDSSNQLQTLLYDCLRLPTRFNEKTKNPSVDDSCLEQLKELHPVVSLIQDYREAHKVYGTYVTGTLERLREGRIYGSFRVNGTVTGRISSADPNLQQLPRSGGVRGIYTPDPGRVLISADYASLEIYLAANFTKDPGLLRIVLNGESMHDITAAGLGISRQLAKSINFAEGYGCSHFKIAKLLGVSEEEGLAAHNRYWDTYAGQKRLMDECAKKVDDGIPIITPWGRRRRFEVRQRKEWDKAYRQAWNFLVQSTGADCTNRAFYIFSEHLEKTGRGRGWFVLHDEIIAEVLPEHADEELENLCRIMTEVGNEIGLEIPLKAEPSGPSERWLD